MSLLHRLEPGARAYMERLIQTGGKPLPQLSVEAARQYMRESQSEPLMHPSVAVKTADASGVPVTIVRPADARGSLPTVVYLHGGGWVLGGIDTHARIVREIALRAKAAVVFPHYTLSPEARFPIAINQSIATARWVQSHGATHGLDSRMAIAGDSAGANLAASVALLAAQEGGPPIRLQVLICPALQAASSTESYVEFAEGLNLTREAMEWFWAQYVPDPAHRLAVTVSPLKAEASMLARVAPALILTAECDVLRDDGELYAHRLAEANIAVTAMRHLGTIHNFPVIDDLQNSAPAIAALDTIGRALWRALHD